MSGRDAAGGGLITWANLFAAKKWRFWRGAARAAETRAYPAENGAPVAMLPTKDWRHRLAPWLGEHGRWKGQ
jgi:hypothetical protein